MWRGARWVVTDTRTTSDDLRQILEIKVQIVRFWVGMDASFSLLSAPAYPTPCPRKKTKTPQCCQLYYYSMCRRRARFRAHCAGTGLLDARSSSLSSTENAGKNVDVHPHWLLIGHRQFHVTRSVGYTEMSIGRRGEKRRGMRDEGQPVVL